MTRSAHGWRLMAKTAERFADQKLDEAERWFAKAEHPAAREDVLVADYYMACGYRCQADATFHRDQAAKWWAYADDAELPVTLTIVTEATA